MESSLNNPLGFVADFLFKKRKHHSLKRKHILDHVHDQEISSNEDLDSQRKRSVIGFGRRYNKPDQCASQEQQARGRSLTRVGPYMMSGANNFGLGLHAKERHDSVETEKIDERKEAKGHDSSAEQLFSTPLERFFGRDQGNTVDRSIAEEAKEETQPENDCRECSWCNDTTRSKKPEATISGFVVTMINVDKSGYSTEDEDDGSWDAREDQETRVGSRADLAPSKRHGRVGESSKDESWRADRPVDWSGYPDPSRPPEADLVKQQTGDPSIIGQPQQTVPVQKETTPQLSVLTRKYVALAEPPSPRGNQEADQGDPESASHRVSWGSTLSPLRSGETDLALQEVTNPVSSIPLSTPLLQCLTFEDVDDLEWIELARQTVKKGPGEKAGDRIRQLSLGEVEPEDGPTTTGGLTTQGTWLVLDFDQEKRSYEHIHDRQTFSWGRIYEDDAPYVEYEEDVGIECSRETTTIEEQGWVAKIKDIFRFGLRRRTLK